RGARRPVPRAGAGTAGHNLTSTTKGIIMRAVLAASICCFAATSAAWSASVTVPDNSTGLAGVAGATTALLLDAGVRPQNSGSGVFVLEVRSFHCDQHLNGALDASNPRAGLPSLTCRINSQNRRGTTAGKPFGEPRHDRPAAEGAGRRRHCLHRLRHGLLRH